MNKSRSGFFGRALKLFWFALKSYFIILGLLVTSFAVILLFLIGNAMEKNKRDVSDSDAGNMDADKIVLRLDFDKDLESGLASEEEQFFRQLFSDRETLSILRMRSVFEKAQKDPKVVGAIINLGGLSGDLTDIASVRRILVSFANSGRGIRAYVPSVNTESLYLASTAQKIFVPQIADVMLFGPSMTSTFFGGLMQKIGVDFSLVRAGEFKSFGEAFIQNDPSEEAKAMNEALVDSLSKTIISAIAVGRSVPVSQVEEWFQRSIYTTPDALNLGIVDEIATASEVVDRAKSEWEGAEVVTYKRYAQADGDADADAVSGDSGNNADGVGFIEASGDIMMDSPESNPDSITPTSIIRQLRWMSRQNRVKSIVLRVDSPGGSALASDLIADVVRTVNQRKPVVVSMGSVAASGGYYIAAPASRILAESSTITGSIGVFGLLPDFTMFREKYGLSFYTYSDSERRALLDPGIKPTAEDLTLIEAQVSQVYKTFLEVVAAGRKMSVKKVDKVAGGRVWTGDQALEIGLVDEIGGLHESFQVAKGLGGLDVNTKVPIYRYERENFLEECLSGVARMLRCLQTGGAQSHLSNVMSTALGVPNVPEMRSLENILSGDQVQILALTDPRYLR